jgi:hypothetical protein
MRDQRIQAWLTRLYPRSWRERYAAEFTALLEQCLSSPLDVLDVILGALDAHLRLLSGEPLNWRVLNMLNKIRTALCIVFASYIGFVIAGLALVGLADDSPMLQLMKTNAALAAAWTTIQAGSAIALLAVVTGGLPLAITILRYALSTPHRVLGWLLVPPIAFLAVCAYGVLIVEVGRGDLHLPGVVQVVGTGVFPAGNRLLMEGWVAIFVLSAIASTLAVWRAVTGTEVEQETFRLFGTSTTVRIYRFAYLPALITTLAMLVMLSATISWVWISFSALPYVPAGNYGPWGTATLPRSIGIIVLMLLATLAAFLGLARARPAQPTA